MLIVATDDALIRLTPRGGAAPSRIDLDVRSVGYVTRIAIDDRTIFVAGANGVLALQRNGGLLQRLDIGGDLPGIPLDVGATRDWVWIATARGLVRIRRAEDGSLQ